MVVHWAGCFLYRNLCDRVIYRRRLRHVLGQSLVDVTSNCIRALVLHARAVLLLSSENDTSVGRSNQPYGKEICAMKSLMQQSRTSRSKTTRPERRAF